MPRIKQKRADPEGVFKKAIDLYCEWHLKWEDYNEREGYGRGYETKEELVAEYLKYSHKPTIKDVTLGHDHYLYTFRVSIGDEAGWWTLYVVADTVVPSGFVGGPGADVEGVWEQMGKIHVKAMWQVFDTTPYAIYELEYEWVKEVHHTVPKPKWFNCPEEDE